MTSPGSGNSKCKSPVAAPECMRGDMVGDEVILVMGPDHGETSMTP